MGSEMCIRDSSRIDALLDCTVYDGGHAEVAVVNVSSKSLIKEFNPANETSEGQLDSFIANLLQASTEN